MSENDQVVLRSVSYRLPRGNRMDLFLVRPGHSIMRADELDDFINVRCEQVWEHILAWVPTYVFMSHNRVNHSCQIAINHPFEVRRYRLTYMEGIQLEQLLSRSTDDYWRSLAEMEAYSLGHKNMRSAKIKVDWMKEGF